MSDDTLHFGRQQMELEKAMEWKRDIIENVEALFEDVAMILNFLKANEEDIDQGLLPIVAKPISVDSTSLSRCWWNTRSRSSPDVKHTSSSSIVENTSR